MLLATSCKVPPRAIAVTPDPAKLAECPQDYPKLGALPPLAELVLSEDTPARDPAGVPVTLPKGTSVVLYDLVLSRDDMTFRFAVAGKGAWQRCASAVTYTIDWGEKMKGDE